MSEGEILIRCDGVGKKFCKSLKRSLWYGAKDIVSEVSGSFGGDSASEGAALRDGEFWAAKDVSFEVRQGDCFALMGSNGAGKTTVLKLLNGLMKPDRGRIELKGVVGALIALGAGFNPILTGRENIYANGAVLGFSKRDLDAKFDDIVDFAGLGEFIDSPVRNYSSGMQVRLGFSIATSINPDVLLIDEVLAVGDFSFRSRCYGRLAKIREETATIFVSHSAQQVTRMCNRGMLLERGAPVMIDNIDKVMLEYARRNAPEQKIKTVYDGEVRLEEATFKNETVSFGKDLTVCVKFDSKERYDGCFVRLLIRKADEDLVGEWNSQLHDRVFDIPIGGSEQEFVIPNLRLHDGVYRMGMFVMASDKVTHLINAQNVAAFESMGHCYGGIPVQF